MVVLIKGLCESYRSDLRLLEWMVSMEHLQHFLRHRSSDKDPNMYWRTDWRNRWVRRLLASIRSNCSKFPWFRRRNASCYLRKNFNKSWLYLHEEAKLPKHVGMHKHSSTFERQTFSFICILYQKRGDSQYLIVRSILTRVYTQQVAPRHHQNLCHVTMEPTTSDVTCHGVCGVHAAPHVEQAHAQELRWGTRVSYSTCYGPSLHYKTHHVCTQDVTIYNKKIR